jgi:poly-gamma-glutamate synthesis protein (capsule biosynthesis protein)
MKNWLVSIGILAFVFLVFAYIVFSKSSLVRVDSTLMDSLEKQRMVSEEATGSSATATLLFVGDIMLSRGVEYVAPKYADKLFPFQLIASTTQDADLTIGNLETPVTSKGPYMVPYSLVFNSNPKYIERLRRAGFDILSSANNHSLDKGEKGLRETVRYIDDGEMASLGAGENCHKGIAKDINGITFGFLAYSYTAYNSGGHVPSELVCDWNDFEKVRSDVKNLKTQVDHVVVLSHTGIEYSTNPTETDREKMHQLIDLGASAVVGAHPHVVQEVEKYKSGVIAYSLGNFVFDNQENPETEKGLMVKLEFNKTDLKNSQKLPIKIKNYCCPELAPYATIKE